MSMVLIFLKYAELVVLWLCAFFPQNTKNHPTSVFISVGWFLTWRRTSGSGSYQIRMVPVPVLMKTRMVVYIQKRAWNWSWVLFFKKPNYDSGFGCSSEIWKLKWVRVQVLPTGIRTDNSNWPTQSAHTTLACTTSKIGCKLFSHKHERLNNVWWGKLNATMWKSIVSRAVLQVQT
jgi:hypothetical protein